MNKEDKALLIKDLSARLPYGVIAHALEINKVGTVTDVNVSYNTINLTVDNANGDYELVPISDIKPYLRPLSSMTEEEDKEYGGVVVKSQDSLYENNESATTMVNDWYLSKGFDVRGLIPKGLALEAPKNMY